MLSSSGFNSCRVVPVAMARDHMAARLGAPMVAAVLVLALALAAMQAGRAPMEARATMGVAIRALMVALAMVR